MTLQRYIFFSKYAKKVPYKFAFTTKNLYLCTRVCRKPHKLGRAEREGKMAEWSIAAVLKTVDLQGSGGSNPSLSAKSSRSIH